MQETIQLNDLWEHNITKIFKLDPKYKVDHMIRQWMIYNKLEDFNSLLNYTDEDFKPHGSGNLSYYKENGDSVVKMMSTTPLQMLENLRWYIQHLIHESGYLYDDDESNCPLSGDKWMLQTHESRHPADISIDRKFQEIMIMPCNLMFRMVIPMGEMLLTLRLKRKTRS